MRTREACSTLIVLNQVDSTNAYLTSHTELPDYSVVISLNQTNGRGRWGREWTNRPGEGIAISVLFPPCDRDHTNGLTLVPLLVGASLIPSINAVSKKPVRMKWPNDILFEEKKLAGILCEVRRDLKIIVGIGLNLVFQDGPPTERAVSLSEIAPFDSASLDGLVSSVLRRLVLNLKLPESEQRRFVTDFLDTKNKCVRVRTKEGGEWTGVALGIDERGALIIRNDSGQEITVLSSEVDHLYQ